MTTRHYGEISLDDYQWATTLSGAPRFRWIKASAIGLSLFLVVVAGNWWRWGGQGTDTLTLRDAVDIVGDAAATETDVVNALGCLQIFAKTAIRTIGGKADSEGIVGDSARLILHKLDKQLEGIGKR